MEGSTPETPAFHPSEETIKKKNIGFLDALSFTITMIIGSGIFIGVGPTFTVFDSDSIGMVIIFWSIAGMISLIGGLCYAELGTRMPESGGERAYYIVGLNQKFSVTYVIIYIFIIKSITLAVLAVTTGSYLSGLFFEESIYLHFFTKVLAIASIVICFVVNCVSKNMASKTGIFFTTLKILGLVMITFVGIYYMSSQKLPEWSKPFELTNFSAARLGSCVMNLFWSFEGWNGLGMVVGDMRNPSRDLPLAIFTGIVLVIALYVLVVVSYSATLGYDIVRISETVAINVGKKAFKRGYFIFPLVISCSTFGSVNNVVYAAGCVTVAAGINGDLPAIFSLVHSTRRTPVFGMLVESLLAIGLTMFRFQVLVNYSGFVSWAVYLTSFCCLIKIKYYHLITNDQKIFQVPIPFIVIIMAVCLFTIVMGLYMNPIGCGIFSLVVLAVFGVQYIPKRYVEIKWCKTLHDDLVIWLCNRFNLCIGDQNDIK